MFLLMYVYMFAKSIDVFIILYYIKDHLNRCVCFIQDEINLLDLVQNVSVTLVLFRVRVSACA